VGVGEGTGLGSTFDWERRMAKKCFACLRDLARVGLLIAVSSMLPGSAWATVV